MVQYLFIGSGERQKFDPSQDMTGNLGKIIRLYPDGSVPEDNPFVGQDGVLPEIWSLGHRNILGMAFDSEGRLWNQEMGPKDGDELNLVQPKANYGYPIVSEGDHYDGKKIPNHDTRPEFTAPKVAWVPTIAPSGMIFYSDDLFPAWKGSAFIAVWQAKRLFAYPLMAKRRRKRNAMPWTHVSVKLNKGQKALYGYWKMAKTDGC